MSVSKVCVRDRVSRSLPTSDDIVRVSIYILSQTRDRFSKALSRFRDQTATNYWPESVSEENLTDKVSRPRPCVKLGQLPYKRSHQKHHVSSVMTEKCRRLFQPLVVGVPVTSFTTRKDTNRLMTQSLSAVYLVFCKRANAKQNHWPCQRLKPIRGAIRRHSRNEYVVPLQP